MMGRGCVSLFLIVWGIGFGAGGVMVLLGDDPDTAQALMSIPFLLGGVVAILFGLRIAFGKSLRGDSDRTTTVGATAGAIVGHVVDVTDGDASNGRRGPRIDRGLDAETGPRTLRSTTRRGCAALFLVPFTLVWLGVTGYLFVEADTPGGPPSFFGWVFGAFAVGIVAATIRALLVITNPRAELDLDRTVIPFGAAVVLPWRLCGSTARLQSLKIELIGREEASYTRGTDRYTDRHEFVRQTLFESAELLATVSGDLSIRIEAGVPTFRTRSNKIVWLLRFSAPIARWPDVNDEIELPVGAPAAPPREEE